jgi:cytochrome P450/NADPH-cytochrome P450 reductase
MRIETDGSSGEIFSLWLGGRRTNFVSTQALLDELCDEKRFSKKTGGALAELRNGVHDGLFVS